MKNMRNKKSRVLALLLSLCMVMTLLPTMAFAADYDDTDGHWAEAEIDRWTDAGVVHGAGDGEFYPNNNMTRAEAAQVFVNLLKLKTKADLSVYTDAGNGAWYDDALSKVVAAGIMNGTSATTLSPVTTLSREMMFVMIARALGVEEEATSDKTFADGEQTSAWAAGYINALVNMGVINGVDSNHIAPLADINRASVMAALDRLVGGYANTDGQTVEIVPGKVTLIVADNVTVSGKADPDVPIIITGEVGKVDMGKVEGEAVVQVNKSDVAIKNAPVGTEIKAAEDAKNVTANDIDVSKDTDKDVIIPEPSKPGTGTGGGGGSGGGGGYTPPTPSKVTEAQIDAILTKGMTDVNNKMMADGAAYAELSGNLSEKNDVTVSISKGDVQVSQVYKDIIDVLVNALNANADKVKNLAAAGTSAKIVLTGGNIDGEQVKTFVKALEILPNLSGATKISELYGKGFRVTIETVDGDKFTYNVKFLCDVDETDINAILNQGITDVNNAMKSEDTPYATLSANFATNHNVTVTITDGKTEVSKVYKDIINILVKALNDNSDKVASIAVDGQDNAKIELNGTEISAEQIKTFVKNAGLLGEDELNGKTPISKLYGGEFTVVITDENGVTYDYTVYFKCNVDEAAVDKIISDGITTVNSKMTDYAKLSELGNNNDVTVTISKGDTTVSKVYLDIVHELVSALNAHAGEIVSVTGKNESAKIELTGSEIEAEQVKSFVQSLQLLDNLSGSTKIYELYGKSFVVNVNDANGESYAYTVWFEYNVNEAAIEEILTQGISDVNGKMKQDETAYATLSANFGSSNDVTVTITNGEITVSKVYTDIVQTLVDALNKNSDKVKTISVDGSDASITLNGTTIQATQIENFVKAANLLDEGQISGSTQIKELYNKEFTVVITDANGDTYDYVVKFVNGGNS